MSQAPSQQMNLMEPKILHYIRVIQDNVIWHNICVRLEDTVQVSLSNLCTTSASEPLVPTARHPSLPLYSNPVVQDRLLSGSSFMSHTPVFYCATYGHSHMNHYPARSMHLTKLFKVHQQFQQSCGLETKREV